VKLLACCTMGKNVYTEIKCHSLLPLDDIVTMVCHKDTIPEVKDAYVNFLTHCYIDTEVEMKEIYTSHHMWQLFERSFLLDMAIVSNATHDRYAKKPVTFFLPERRKRTSYSFNKMLDLSTFP
jgi:inositol 1,4,5-triphosphate receptor type 1